MRRAATWAVVVGLVALGVLAVVEVFVRDDEPGARGAGHDDRLCAG